MGAQASIKVSSTEKCSSISDQSSRPVLDAFDELTDNVGVDETVLILGKGRVDQTLLTMARPRNHSSVGMFVFTHINGHDKSFSIDYP